ncbi:nitrile hydratase accessory protein [Aestuariicoccus sp. MJ-SS9]|uniref:nitrile hydratase accessory protein n=1 Tax=Aestuariicoccus sp. MJ-SS9 TaxID=3079855 RepID=UPI002910AF45|nr:nitrile hydratase accessory protein [Aestuariicoccus sp. MJ-SS9]MDU8913255.1 nitrile hydratase accessory protein [Aestuariicoccus sp. MJ-SS9]
MDEPVFEAPWHAQAFAVAVHLNARGAFTWPEWAAVFGAVLAEHGVEKELNGGDDYFLAWVAALERICADKGLAEHARLAELKAAWEEAYLSTPHGSPVHLAQ